MGKWARVYSDILDDEKIANMSLKCFRFFIFLLTYQSECQIKNESKAINKEKTDINNVKKEVKSDGQSISRSTLRDTTPKTSALPDAKTICWRFRITKKTYNQCVKELESLGIISIKNKELTINKWNKRQYKSDSSTDRVKRFRERSEKRSMEQSSSVSETVYHSNRVHSTEKEVEKESNKEKEEEKLHVAPLVVPQTFLHTQDFYFLAGKKFYENYPWQKDEEKAIRCFKSICKKRKSNTADDVNNFLSVCLFSIRQQVNERDLMIKYKIPVPLWKYAVNWLENGCWNDKVLAAAEIKQQAIDGGYYKPNIAEKLEEAANKHEEKQNGTNEKNEERDTGEDD